MSAPSQVLTQLEAILTKDPLADCIALVWPEATTERSYSNNINDYSLQIIYCDSELAIREQLVSHRAKPSDDSTRLVVLSAFDYSRLGNDVLSRLWRNEPQRINPWRALEQILNVREIDPRLTKQGYRWVAKTLLTNHEHYKNQIHFGEVLDLDKAWQALACGLLGFKATSLDMPALFDWSLLGGRADAVAALPKEMMDNLGDWLKAGIPDTERLVRQIWLSGHADQFLSIGLVCSVLYHPDLIEASKKALKTRATIVDEESLIGARARFGDRYLGGSFSDRKALQSFGEQARLYVDHILANHISSGKQNSGLQQSFAEAEQSLASLDLMNAVLYSDLLPGGFRLRLDRMSEAFEKALKGQALDSVKTALRHLKKHRLAQTGSTHEQAVRAEMAIRLLEWLKSQTEPLPDPSALMDQYIHNGSFVDWARSKIWQGDVHEGLSDVYQALSIRVGKHRESLNEEFAKYLPAIARADQQKPGLLFVEETLDKLVTPLAKDNPILLLVLDGMSMAVYRELANDLSQNNWLELSKESNPAFGLVAALPTITKVSRCSLLSGQLKEGVASDEKKAFAAHPALKTLASTKFPPKLYHKADLQNAGSGALSNDVRSVLAGKEHRITSVVINAIDDQLSSNAQVSVDWKVDTIALLRQVLEAARESSRLVIMTSDHGHVFDHDMLGRSQIEGGERYKPTSLEVETGEVKLSGSRVLSKDNAIIVPWSEKVRYASKKMGYHGGGSLQEVVIPLGVYADSRLETPPKGWVESPVYQPDWWLLESNHLLHELKEEQPELLASAEPKPKKALSSKAKIANDLMDDLFPELLSPSEQTVNGVVNDKDWISALLKSPNYHSAKSRAGRMAVKEDQLLKLLKLLEANGLQLMIGPLTQALGIPKLRIYGFLAGAQKLLNVDGYAVLSIDRTSETVKLNIESLKTQFEISV